MELNTPLTNNVDTLFSNLENFTQNEGLIGKPLTHNDKTFIPVVTVSLGYGSGNTINNKGAQDSSSSKQAVSMGDGTAGGALGLGAKLSTEAIIVIDKDNVSMMQMNAAQSASQLMDKIPEILMGMNQNNQGQEKQNQAQNNQGQNNQGQNNQGQQTKQGQNKTQN